MTESNGEPQQRQETLRFLSQTHRSLHERRAGHEIQVLIATLTFYALAGATRFSSSVQVFSGAAFHAVCWTLFLAIAVITSIFLTKLHRSNHINKQQAERAERALEEMVYSDSDNKAPNPSVNAKDLGWLWQTLLVFTFAIASAVILTLPPPPSVAPPPASTTAALPVAPTSTPAPKLP